MEAHAHGKKLGPGSLMELQAVLWIVDGWLLLTDEELTHYLGEVHGVFNAVSIYSELVKAVAELTAGAISLTASYAAAIARLAGDTSAAAMATRLARSAGLLFANVIAGIEITHGVAVLLDPHARGRRASASAERRRLPLLCGNLRNQVAARGLAKWRGYPREAPVRSLTIPRNAI
jgi:hypothetical protein